MMGTTQRDPKGETYGARMDELDEDEEYEEEEEEENSTMR